MSPQNDDLDIRLQRVLEDTEHCGCPTALDIRRRACELTEDYMSKLLALEGQRCGCPRHTEPNDQPTRREV